MITKMTTNGANWISMSVDPIGDGAGGLGEGGRNQQGRELRRRAERGVGESDAYIAAAVAKATSPVGEPETRRPEIMGDHDFRRLSPAQFPANPLQARHGET